MDFSQKDPKVLKDIEIRNRHCRILPDQKLSLMQAIVRSGQEIAHSCGGMGTCGTCRVMIIAEGSCLLPRNELEQEMAQDRGFLETERLSCQIFAAPGLIIEIPDP